MENRANSLDPNWIRVDDIWKHGATEIGKKLSEKLGISINEVFENFINSIQNSNIPETDGVAALKALKIAFKIQNIRYT